MYQYFIGIDISKKDFYVALHHSHEVKIYQNDASGYAVFFKDYQKLLKQGLVVLETTGGYEMALIHYLLENHCSIHRANTRKVKFFIRSYGHLAKTDKIDARALALYGQERHASLELFKQNAQEKLLKLVERRLELKKMLVQEKNRKQAPCAQLLRASFDKIIKVLEAELKNIEQELEAISKIEPALIQKKQVLKDIKGVGNITAIHLLALLPELGSINRRKIASLAGLAPHPNESGKKIGYRSTKGGRANIKPILFMAAMTASRSQTRLGEFYRQLVKMGKKKMVALTALMRKMLVIANAKIRDFLALNKLTQHG